ncbi:MAG: 2-oxoacid:acceptor oxidoreductase subunit alpha [Hydrotalea flava]|uniref:2-oxoacid:acceptor oxidoreductase subunit alpha n=1 Tax=Hydrotalea TaxID=1004300 RepID=UPI0009449C11|nr:MULTISPECIES: 2-oxoacid:acceptor oxidoreductase subunit alpha [Hydrotalea]MBY0348953.1 2-oxoacid:acceptor oxidoreductase subunit alpha [Hydrotalea flava]NIM35354.1 2-oxoacid:acceptor oxidoreductase subunit alpha [Hydrotalea flava]NIM38213.1 2-oxoacid:acceptor oxidoreductase subunit alpha [Hydrotalea flava]NIN03377.1 2-oxoacid:acceptor oxidoreductase subunit alpha [Hydrotalea flava]NIN15071.1 2-oxoacid:acceptor oxidoreductase subunit alpha [Hydrotalea flava]
MNRNEQLLQDVVIKFAGDSGDGMQLTGQQFTNNTALLGIDLATFPDFPAEIRAPIGTLPGVSGYQLHFSSNKVYTPGDIADVLVAMNAAALKVNLKSIKPGGKIIANIDGFDAKNLRLANYPDGVNPLEDGSLDSYEVIKIDVTKLTREALKDFTDLGTKERDRAKNMFVLGFIYWMYNRTLDNTIAFLKEKFGKKESILRSNIKVLQAGYNYGDTTETFTTRYKVEKAKLPAGTYRSIMGNQALAYGLIAASQKSELPLFLGSYPITPASDILHELSKYKGFGVKTFQAEDEIAAISSSIGASYGGSLGITTTSGPGMALKAEAMGLAVMLEIPLVIVDIQRGGPSTGLPTKTEQSDLMQAYYGRNGECPMPIIASATPSDCFDVAYEACRIAVQHMTPVILLSDGYIANGAEPWRFPKAADLKPIEVAFAPAKTNADEKFQPYVRDEKLVRPWAVPGTAGLEHRIGGLEKQDITGNVSYDPDNHQHMVKIRQAKVDKIADHIPLQHLDSGAETGDLLVIGWGSTYGAIKSAVLELQQQGYVVSHAHLRYVRPFPKNLGQIIKGFKQVLVPEINNGQLVKILRDIYMVDAKGYNKIMGIPITKTELVAEMSAMLKK